VSKNDQDKGPPPSAPLPPVFIIKGDNVLCFDTLLQVLILKELEGSIIPSQNLRSCLSLCMRRILPWGTLLIPEKKKREKAPAVEAQIFTRFIIAEGL